MRISDWSSDVCSSDLVQNEVAFGIVEGFHIVTGKVKQDASVAPPDRLCDDLPNECRLTRAGCPGEHDMALLEPIRERERRDLIWHYDPRCFAISERKCFDQIGRASVRERVCQYVSISWVAGTLKKKI